LFEVSGRFVVGGGSVIAHDNISETTKKTKTKSENRKQKVKQQKQEKTNVKQAQNEASQKTTPFRK
jgi:hypothetical protein